VVWQIIINGDVRDRDTIKDLAEQLREVIDTQDIVIIGKNSRQAAELSRRPSCSPAKI
jgi:tRNA-dihydrouridine synthase